MTAPAYFLTARCSWNTKLDPIRALAISSVVQEIPPLQQERNKTNPFIHIYACNFLLYYLSVDKNHFIMLHLFAKSEQEYRRKEKREKRKGACSGNISSRFVFAIIATGNLTYMQTDGTKLFKKTNISKTQNGISHNVQKLLVFLELKTK